MADDERCPKIAGCPMFEMFSHQGTLGVWQINYCEGRYKDCVRYQKSNCGEHVDDNLLPNGKRLPTLK